MANANAAIANVKYAPNSIRCANGVTKKKKMCTHKESTKSY